MTTAKLYKVFDPLKGEYQEVQTKEECLALVADYAISMFLSHTHGTPYSICETNENGTQTWRNAQGEEIIDPEEFDRKIQEKIGTSLSSISATPIEVLP